MNMYKSQRKCAIAVLIPILLLVLLSVHFHIWSGSYIEGDLESAVVQHVESLEKMSTGRNTEEIEQYRHIFDVVYLSGIEIDFCLQGALLWGDCFNYSFFRPSITLCSLSVRIND